MSRRAAGGAVSFGYRNFEVHRARRENNFLPVTSPAVHFSRWPPPGAPVRRRAMAATKHFPSHENQKNIIPSIARNIRPDSSMGGAFCFRHDRHGVQGAGRRSREG
jgi:hypothetical protein